MKKLVFAVATIASLSATAQTKEGKVVYERTIKMSNITFGNSNMSAEMQAEMQAEMAARMPKSRTDQYELLFNVQHSVYQFLPSATEEGGGGFNTGGGGMVQMRMGQNDVNYTNFETGLKTDQKEIMDKSFVVVDSIRKLKWKLSDETKTILNFTARKATASTITQRPRVTMENGQMKREMQTDTVPVVAWYTTQVPVPAGPSYAGQLPGLILEVDVNKGQNVITAVEFSPKVSANKIKEPKDGRKLTQAEFEQEREKIMQEMQRNFSRPGGGLRITQQ